MARRPILIPREVPGLGGTVPMAVNGDASKVYLGRVRSMAKDRRNLLVVTLDRSGAMAGEPAALPDSPAPLPTGGRSTVRLIRLHPSGRKLYVGFSLDYPLLPAEPSVPERRVLTVYDLTEAGDPTGPPRSVDTLNGAGSLMSLAKHPTLDLLYLVGQGEPQVVVYPLDALGEPMGPPTPYPVAGSRSHGKWEVAVRHDGRRLYLGTYPGRLEIVELEAGVPVGSVRDYDGRVEGVVGDVYYRFFATRHALYWRPPFELSSTFDVAAAPLVIWPLDERGDPVGRPRVDGRFPGFARAVDEASRRVWHAGDLTYADAFDPNGRARRAGSVLFDVPLDPTGFPNGPGTVSATRYGEEVLTVDVAGDGTPVALLQARAPDRGNQVRGWHLRVTLEHADPAPAGDVPIWVGSSSGPRQRVAVGAPAVFTLDALLRDNAGPVLVGVGIDAPIDACRVRFEVFDGDPAGDGSLVRDLTDSVAGDLVYLLVPGYGFVEPGRRPERTELLSSHAWQHLERAHVVAVPDDERPRRFVVSCYHLKGLQGHLEELQMEAKTVSLLGFNTAIVERWPGLSPAEVDRVLRAYGLQRRSHAVYSPLDGYNLPPGRPHDPAGLGYFDLYYRRYPDDVRRWAEQQLAQMRAANAGRPEDLVDFKLADEPGWYYPDVIRRVRANPDYLADFRAFLAEKRREHGLPENFFGQPLDEVLPISGALGRSLQTRRGAYWTARFFAESASRGSKLVTDVFERVVGHPLCVAVNCTPGYGISAWYVNSPNQQFGYNPDAGPDAGYGSFDWFVSGRLGAHTLWSEDWQGDRNAQVVSVYSDALRSAASLGARPEFGAYVTGNTLGDHPAGASYKVLSLVGHGAKVLDFFTFGPPLYGNAWSDRLHAYGAVADALRLLGRAEHVLHPGRPLRGNVALHVPSTSRLWDASPEQALYVRELQFLHFALVHTGYAVDLVDDEDLASGALGARGYTTLYVTAPNLAGRAAAGIVRWVRDGGTLAVTIGAGVADEYDTPSTALDSLLGVRPRVADRTLHATGEAIYYADELTLADPDLGTGIVPLRGPVAALEPVQGGATVSGRRRDGRAAVTRHRTGAGTSIVYGFYPGYQYMSTRDDPPPYQPTYDPHRLPRGWGAAERLLAVAPARIARTPKPVTVNVPLVEACRLESDHGIGIVLLNWSDEPVDIEVTVPNPGRFREVKSAQGVEASARCEGRNLRIDMALQHVDVLLLEERGAPPR